MSEPKRYGFPDCECDATDEFYMEDKGMCELLDGGFVKWEDYAALKAEVERLRKAGDDLEFLVCFNYEGDIKGDKHCMGILDAWLAAKERNR